MVEAQLLSEFVAADNEAAEPGQEMSDSDDGHDDGKHAMEDADDDGEDSIVVSGSVSMEYDHAEASSLGHHDSSVATCNSDDVELLKHVLPDLDLPVLAWLLASCDGDLQQAVDTGLELCTTAHARQPPTSELESLRQLFPHLSEKVLQTALANSDGLPSATELLFAVAHKETPPQRSAAQKKTGKMSLTSFQQQVEKLERRRKQHRPGPDLREIMNEQFASLPAEQNTVSEPQWPRTSTSQQGRNLLTADDAAIVSGRETTTKRASNVAATEDPSACRSEALLHANARRRLLDKAAEAHRRGDGATAGYYADQARKHMDLIKTANARAAKAILASGGCSLHCLDCHGLHVNEAIAAIQELLEQHRAGIAVKGSAWPHRTLQVITGRGAGSAGGKARIKPAVINFLRGNRYEFTESTGSVNIKLR